MESKATGLASTSTPPAARLAAGRTWSQGVTNHQAAHRYQWIQLAETQRAMHLLLPTVSLRALGNSGRPRWSATTTPPACPPRPPSRSPEASRAGEIAPSPCARHRLQPSIRAKEEQDTVPPAHHRQGAQTCWIPPRSGGRRHRRSAMHPSSRITPAPARPHMKRLRILAVVQCTSARRAQRQLNRGPGISPGAASSCPPLRRTTPPLARQCNSPQHPQWVVDLWDHRTARAGRAPQGSTAGCDRDLSYPRPV